MKVQLQMLQLMQMYSVDKGMHASCIASSWVTKDDGRERSPSFLLLDSFAFQAGIDIDRSRRRGGASRGCR